jgi:hypothetical protein
MCKNSIYRPDSRIRKEEQKSEGDQEDDLTPVDSKEANRRNHTRRAPGGNAATSKWCPGCFENKELSDYHKNSGYTRGHQEAFQRNKERWLAGGGAAATSKRCTRCVQDKELDDYNKNINNVDGRATRCKVCSSSERRKKRKGNDGKCSTDTAMDAGTRN